MNIEFTVNDAAVTAMLHKLSQKVANLQPAMAEIGDALKDRIADGFSKSTSPWGSRWASLSQTTILQRLGKNKANFTKRGKISAKGQRTAAAGFQPLMDTGALRNGISSQSDANSVTVGTSPQTPYATTHQFGARRGAFGSNRIGRPIPWGDIPARPFMPIRNDRVDLPEVWMNDIIAVINRHLKKATA